MTSTIGQRAALVNVNGEETPASIRERTHIRPFDTAHLTDTIFSFVSAKPRDLLKLRLTCRQFDRPALKAAFVSPLTPAARQQLRKSSAIAANVCRSARCIQFVDRWARRSMDLGAALLSAKVCFGTAAMLPPHSRGRDIIALLCAVHVFDKAVWLIDELMYGWDYHALTRAIAPLRTLLTEEPVGTRIPHARIGTLVHQLNENRTETSSWARLNDAWDIVQIISA